MFYVIVATGPGNGSRS